MTALIAVAVGVIIGCSGRTYMASSKDSPDKARFVYIKALSAPGREYVELTQKEVWILIGQNGRNPPGPPLLRTNLSFSASTLTWSIEWHGNDRVTVVFHNKDETNVLRTLSFSYNAGENVFGHTQE